jgi:hypothetical protein
MEPTKRWIQRYKSYYDAYYAYYNELLARASSA